VEHINKGLSTVNSAAARGGSLCFTGGSKEDTAGGTCADGGPPLDNFGNLEGRRRDFPASQHQTEER
jgi:hypothetical protein